MICGHPENKQKINNLLVTWVSLGIEKIIYKHPISLKEFIFDFLCKIVKSLLTPDAYINVG